MKYRPASQAWTHAGPWAVEVLASTVRVVDAQGNDVLLIGDVATPGVLELARRIAAARGAEAQAAVAPTPGPPKKTPTRSAS